MIRVRGWWVGDQTIILDTIGIVTIDGQFRHVRHFIHEHKNSTIWQPNVSTLVLSTKDTTIFKSLQSPVLRKLMILAHEVEDDDFSTRVLGSVAEDDVLVLSLLSEESVLSGAKVVCQLGFSVVTVGVDDEQDLYPILIL